MLRSLPYLVLNGPPLKNARTEDVKFSPTGGLLAAVATNGSMFLFAVDTRSRPIRIIGCTELRSSSLSSPHGIDFLSEDVVVVANRSGWVTFYRIPNVNAWEERMNIEPIHEMESVWFGHKGATRLLGDRNIRCGPGSVRVHDRQLFICCNNLNTVTVHGYRLQQGVVETNDGTVVVQAGVEIPDGVALSRDGRWMAVSDHHHQRVIVYRRSDEAELCVLRDADLSYPHGLCFDPAGQVLYVADAGQRYVHVFVSASGWDRSTDRSTFKLLAVDADAFDRTRKAKAGPNSALEGGIKGIDIDPSGRILATTCRNQTLRFFEAEWETVATDGSLAAAAI